MNITNVLRKNIGTIITVFGFLLLCIITFGDLGEIVSEDYWNNVFNNITSISFVTIGLTLIQVTIKQGLAEQALQRGLNTEKTAEKYEEHRELIKSCNEKMVYLPYFLQIYNRRHTSLQKQEFLINNNYCSEDALFISGDKKSIKKYNQILVNISAASIKWSTVDITYSKNGRIVTLDEYRIRRIYSSVISSFGSMIGVTFLAGGLFFSPSTEPFWQKLVKLFTYIVAIGIGAIFTVVKEYEKGAFGIPNELDEINQIWREFISWEIPNWVINEVAKLNKNSTEVKDEQADGNTDPGTNIQEKQAKCTNIKCSGSDKFLGISGVSDDVSTIHRKE